MESVYVLSGRDWLANNEWGTGSEIEVYGVYSDLEKAKIAFKDKVLEIAKNLADTEDEFKYTDETLFEFSEAKDDAFGWEYYDFSNSCGWELCLPENDDYDYGCWFLPNAKLIRYEIK